MTDITVFINYYKVRNGFVTSTICYYSKRIVNNKTQAKDTAKIKTTKGDKGLKLNFITILFMKLLVYNIVIMFF